MKSILKHTLAALAACALLVPASALAGDDAPAPTGPEVFSAQKCTSCHSVTAAGISYAPDLDEKGPDLSKTGAEMDRRAIASYLLKRTDRNGEKHKKTFGGNTAELRVIAEWLETFK